MDNITESIAFRDILSKASTTDDLDDLIGSKILEHKRSNGNSIIVPAYVEHQMAGGTETFEEFSQRYTFDVTDSEVAAFKSDHYADMRKASYPPMAELADALVKGDEAQLEAYKQACLDVKKRFPKP